MNFFIFYQKYIDLTQKMKNILQFIDSAQI
jgi:hypothetical protein